MRNLFLWPKYKIHSENLGFQTIIINYLKGLKCNWFLFQSNCHFNDSAAKRKYFILKDYLCILFWDIVWFQEVLQEKSPYVRNIKEQCALSSHNIFLRSNIRCSLYTDSVFTSIIDKWSVKIFHQEISSFFLFHTVTKKFKSSSAPAV